MKRGQFQPQAESVSLSGVCRPLKIVLRTNILQIQLQVGNAQDIRSRTLIKQTLLHNGLHAGQEAQQIHLRQTGRLLELICISEELETQQEGGKSLPLRSVPDLQNASTCRQCTGSAEGRGALYSLEDPLPALLANLLQSGTHCNPTPARQGDRSRLRCQKNQNLVLNRRCREYHSGAQLSISRAPAKATFKSATIQVLHLYTNRHHPPSPFRPVQDDLAE